MRNVSIFVALSSAVLVFAACASEGDTIPPQKGNPQATTESPQTIPDAAPPPEKKCAPSCATDDDCLNSCPAPTTGRACCDKASGLCYSHNEATCPAPPSTSSSSGGY